MQHSVICTAIRERRLLRLTYDLKSRLVEPHAYGVTKDGNEVLRAWQESPFPPDWKLFRLDKASGISITDTHFSGPRRDFERGDRALHQTYCEL